jgi:mRNA interferase MazF
VVAPKELVKKQPFSPGRGDIVWIQHDPQAGREMKGMHPLLIISSKAFVERTGIVIGFPMTHAAFNADNPFAVAVQGAKKEVGYILCHQPKSFDWGVRGGGKHPWGEAPAKVLREALNRLDTICGISEG